MKTSLIGLVIWTLLSGHANAETQNKIFIGGWSHHFNSKSSPNEVHNNLGVSYRSWDLMYFKNSYSKPSIMMAKNFDLFWGIGVKVGAASGYQKAKYNAWGVVPVAQLTYSVSVGAVGVELGYVPYSGVKSDGLVSASFFVKF
ncbi:MAG: hypothetical protein ACRCTP_03755 [Aeromonas popoffii]|uniref:hypothetical protein n=1 Tax=Aeromonas popoffii TaxID=70856 RepID=UPI003F334BC3